MDSWFALARARDYATCRDMVFGSKQPRKPSSNQEETRAIGMDLLEQPLEAVAFRLYSLPEVAAAGAAAWTCLAAVLAAAAAAGVWRLRSSATAGFTDDPKPLQLDTSTSLVSSSETRRSPEMPTTSVPAPSPKERYTAYYQDGGRVGCCGVESDDEEDEEKLDPQDDCVYGPWGKKDLFEWEVVRSLVPVVATATTDVIGRYRSPRAVSGTVVRLWDQGAQLGLTAAIPRRGIIRASTASSF
ncbi:uncharacterized protein LOC124706664 [Lolium rigidum]|uniref:uncharacterized protein LOC124706664 n=1 Tax=Lolium rigidum TaxID=89674 RepID=UPI001F5DE267|nr:uncharacterized protein LOC124706664 [Lolium rigidum]